MRAWVRGYTCTAGGFQAVFPFFRKFKSYTVSISEFFMRSELVLEGVAEGEGLRRRWMRGAAVGGQGAGIVLVIADQGDCRSCRKMKQTHRL